MKKQLFIIRGLPGSGKSTLAETLAELTGAYWFEADMFFLGPMGYKFDPSKIHDAHKWCQQMVEEEMVNGGTQPIIVSNTFTRNWEMQPYIRLAEAHGYKITVLTVEGGYDNLALARRNVHGVPMETIADMRQRWESYLA